jgi:hypothetical protein
MISCEGFRERLSASPDDAEVLDHLRHCDPCLDYAAHVEPDLMFRAMGGVEMTPPGGTDAFVEEVMQQVRVRSAEKAMNAPASAAVRFSSVTRRLAVAATMTVAITGATFVYRQTSSPDARMLQPVARANVSTAVQPVALVSLPVVESWDSENATIVEVPADASDDVKIVMIFDENLPVDL